ncbi:hypothetical protein [Paraburkholderia sp. D15]|uniref:hypothetical protein n=1 Tax=Paraburkholderia sp. D15 TaxID=2880218 RepID=UPI0032B05DAB
MKNKATLALSLLASLVLVACGGGGSSSSTTPSTSNASLPATPPAPVAAANGESLPSLSSPQNGSTKVVGNGVEGIWTSQSGAGKTTAFIDAQGNVSALNSLGTFTVSELFGVVAATSPNWTLTSGVQVNNFVYYRTSAGSGTFVNNQTFTGSYVQNGNTVAVDWAYDPANALAVTQASVAGTWSQSGASLTIANDGTLSGTLSNCPVTGTLLLATPASSKNLYTLTVTGANAACGVTPGTTLTGNAAITFLPISGSSLYVRSILYVIRATNNSSVAYGQLTKQ